METISFARGAPAPDLLPLEELADCAATVLARDGKTHPVVRCRRRLRAASRADRRMVRRASRAGAAHKRRVAIARPAREEARTRERDVVRVADLRPRVQVVPSGRPSILVATVDDHGVDPVNVEVALVGQSTPAFMYLIPTFQNPTGTTLTDERRQSLVKFSQRRNVLIVEDDPYSLVRFEGEPLPALFDYTGKTSVYLSSFSKTIAPGLRVGFSILPDKLADELSAAATDTTSRRCC